MFKKQSEVSHYNSMMNANVVSDESNFAFKMLCNCISKRKSWTFQQAPKAPRYLTFEPGCLIFFYDRYSPLIRRVCNRYFVLWNFVDTCNVEVSDSKGRRDTTFLLIIYYLCRSTKDITLEQQIHANSCLLFNWEV